MGRQIALGTIETALAIARRMKPATVDVTRCCAVFDSLYMATYRQLPNGLFIYAGNAKLASTPKQARLGETRYIELDAQSIDDGCAFELCAFCETPGRMMFGARISSVHCSGCERSMCLGRTKGELFECANGCGKKGRLSANFVSSSGIKREAARTAPLALNGHSAKVPKRLLLGGR